MYTHTVTEYYKTEEPIIRGYYHSKEDAILNRRLMTPMKKRKSSSLIIDTID